ncbi:AbrB/MazE/SpoVT family DNA-binding domain-containing protein [Nocardia takedensis]|uniref:AbrB/MazE/SpoVT family DNA-binding domain-containing protein n=1 Tax=Nocardia takedensis TaxID=259390 RepID=UPI000311607C|nr:AbrB/MazE/SpoVT family DNA-binding domain-containing protein [Nocardia takedensis]
MAIGVSIITDRARITARRMFEAMGWHAGTRIGFWTDGRIITVDTTGGSRRRTIGPRGQIRLPAEFQQATGISAGDYLLIVALADRGVVAIVPLPVVISALAGQLSAPKDGR